MGIDGWGNSVDLVDEKIFVDIDFVAVFCDWIGEGGVGGGDFATI